MEVIQTTEGTSGARAAVFFLALSFFFSQLGVNVCFLLPFIGRSRLRSELTMPLDLLPLQIAGNAITGGIDLACTSALVLRDHEACLIFTLLLPALFPKYVNTTRVRPHRSFR
jgi:hypothetical protein